jgi:apolipoprotein N-acyltransferase
MSRLRLRLWGIAAAVVSGTALWHGTGLEPWWWMTWLGPWPVLAFGLRAPAPATAAVALSAWAAGGLNLWHYYRALETPLPVVLAAVTLPAVAFAATVLLVRTLARRGRPVMAALALPAAWTALEHLGSRLSPHGTFGSLAYTQMDCLPVVQVASLVGFSGITFVLMLVPSGLAMATSPSARPSRARIAWVTSAAVALVLGYGGGRVLREDDARTSVTVGLGAADHPEQPISAETDEGRLLVEAYGRAAEALGTRGAQVVVLPETVFRATPAGTEAVTRRFAGIAEAGVVVVVGADRVDTGRESNATIALQADHATVYAKQHLLLPLESRFQPGTDLAVLSTPSGRLGLAVCKDMDFPPLGRLYAQRGVSMMLVPAWDFTVDGWLHSRMAVLRGIEGGFAVARAARDGRLTLSDDRGRILGEADTAGARMASVLAGARVGPAGTPYTKLGDWFGWLSCAVLALAIASSHRVQR